MAENIQGTGQPGTASPTPGHRRLQGAELRASDQERDAVAAELAEHLKDGRLQVAEFDERVSKAISARTRGDLDGLLTDLPRLNTEPGTGLSTQLSTQRNTGQAPAGRRPRPPFPLVAVPIVVGGMAILGAISHAASASGHPVWAIWWLWWLIPLSILFARRRIRGHRPQEWR
jgi:Domain of unknown function (DUF1707)